MSKGKDTTPKAATLAAKTLRNPKASQIQKTLAASVLGQAGGGTTSPTVASKASAALKRSSSASTTKKLAGSALSQKVKRQG